MPKPGRWCICADDECPGFDPKSVERYFIAMGILYVIGCVLFIVLLCRMAVPR